MAVRKSARLSCLSMHLIDCHQRGEDSNTCTSREELLFISASVNMTPLSLEFLMAVRKSARLSCLSMHLIDCQMPPLDQDRVYLLSECCGRQDIPWHAKNMRYQCYHNSNKSSHPRHTSEVLECLK